MPSERFLLLHRLFTFLDEWLFYLLLIFWWVRSDWIALAITAVLGTIFVLYSYKRQWAWEDARFDMKIKDWKQYWADRQQDPAHRREVRQEKAAARRLHHKRNRKKAQRKLREAIDILNEDLED